MLHVRAQLAPTSAPAELRLARASSLRPFGIAFFLVALSLILVRVFAFDAAVDAAASLLSRDGEIAPRRQTLIGTLMIEAAICSGLLGSLMLMLSTQGGRGALQSLLLQDPLKRYDNQVPNGLLVMAASSIAGLVLVALWLVRLTTPLKIEFLFAKEGALELVTFLALAGSAVLCWLAARNQLRSSRAMASRASALCYAVLGVGLFVVGMEEISWGQTYLRWQTPESWAAINSQQETTVHNLLDQPTLHVIEQRLIYLFVALAFIAMYLAVRQVHPFVTALAPHFSTAPILLLIAYAAFHFHLEVPEILFSIFIVCYAWRAYRASVVSPTAVAGR